MSKKTEPLKIAFTFSVTKKVSSYDNDTIVQSSFTETVPPEMDAMKYMRSRIAEELSRQKVVYDAQQAESKGEKDLLDDVGF